MIEKYRQKSDYKVIGVMSGTSLDGLDIAFCSFQKQGESYIFQIGECTTIPYPEEWIRRLQNLPGASAFEFAAAHAAYGKYIGGRILEFLKQNRLTADFVASHGHTIFHQPNLGFTSQIGDGAAMAAICELPVICDFRSGDLAQGGQGAPLVPMGDKMLFDEYSHCLNLGGFGNISYETSGQRIAFDICPVNFLLNHLAAKAGLAFDNNGEIAASGEVDDTLLSRLNNLPYYQKKHPKSLGREWVEQEILPLIDSLTMSLSNLMRTAVEHIAMQLSNVFTQSQVRKVLITGGGAYNKFLIQRLDTLSGFRTTLPDPKIIDFKEALIFAFLGLLRMHGTPNCISSVTGAVKNVCGGAIYLP